MTTPPIIPGNPPPPDPEPYYPPQSAPPSYPGPPQQYYPQPGYYPYAPPQPQVITKPGGLSGTAHAVHILITLMTCLAWLPFYCLFILFAPSRRTEVIVPVGADPAAVAAAYAAAAPTAREKRTHNQNLLAVVLVVVGLAAFCGVFGTIVNYSGR